MKPPEALKVAFTYTPADIEHAHRVYQTTKPIFWVGAAIALCALASGCLAFYGIGASYAYSVLLGSSYPFIGVYPLQFAALAVLLALAIWFEPFSYLLRRLHFRRNTGIYGNKVEMEFTEVSVTVARGASRETYEWRFFGEAIEGSREYLLVVPRTTAFLVVPKSAIPRGRQEGFWAMIGAKIGKRRTLRRAPPLFLA
jgi:hypothetical protein